MESLVLATRYVMHLVIDYVMRYLPSSAARLFSTQRQRFSAAKFRKYYGAALSLTCLMCGKCAANLANSAVRQKCGEFFSIM